MELEGKLWNQFNASPIKPMENTLQRVASSSVLNISFYL